MNESNPDLKDTNADSKEDHDVDYKEKYFITLEVITLFINYSN